MDYSKDGPFQDPLLRCDSCTKIVKTETLRNLGRCPKCGNRRVRNVQTLTPEEIKQAQDWDIDPEFFALFEEVEE